MSGGGLYLPGIRSMAIKQMNNAIARYRRSRPDLEAAYEEALENAEATRDVLRNAFPDLGAGRTDLYKAFAWRNWHLIRASTGRVGVVLPRTALQTKGSEQWRKTILFEGAFGNIAVLLNTGGWVFDDVDGRYTVGLCSLCKGIEHADDVTFSPPYSSRVSYEAGRKSNSESVPASEFASWSDDASFPQLPDHPGALKLFRKLRSHPRLDGQVGRSVGRTDGRTTGQPALSPMEGPALAGRPQRDQRQAPVQTRRWRVRPLAELHATADKYRFILDSGKSARTGS